MPNPPVGIPANRTRIAAMIPTIEGSPRAVASRYTSAATITAIMMPIIDLSLLPRVRTGREPSPSKGPRSPVGSPANRASSVDEDRRAQRDAPHEDLQVVVRGSQATRRARPADAPGRVGAVDGEAGAAAPAGRHVGVVARPGGGAAAVVRAVVAA